MRWHCRVPGGAVGVLFLVLSGCGDDDHGQSFLTAPPTPTPRPAVIFNAEANRLRAYDASDGFRTQVVIPSHRDDPAHGRDINGQICFVRDSSARFIAGEDTGQPNPPQGWGFFQLHGDAVGSLSATQIGKLTPTYQNSPDNAENYGCGFLGDGRLVTTDVGDQASGPPNGQLIVWFPPFDAPQPRYCKLDVTIGTAGGIFVDAADHVYVASARVDPGIYRYAGPFPTGDDAAGGCGRRDVTGAPLADAVEKSLLIGADAHVRTPNAVVGSPHGTLYVSSVLNGVIAEYGIDGRFVRRILEPRSGERLPFPSTGTPLGLGIDRRGTLYYADIGLKQSASGIGPGANLGTVRQVRVVDGEPQPPDTMNSGLNFPDGIGVLER